MSRTELLIPRPTLIIPSHYEVDSDRAMVIMRRENFEPELMIQRAMRFSVTRHGEPTEFAEAEAGLSPKGKREEYFYAVDFITGLELLDCPVEILGLYSPVFRVTECAAIIKQQLQIEQYQRGFTDLTIRGFFPCRLIDGTGTLKPLIDRGVPKERAYFEYINSTEAYLLSIGSKPHTQVYADQMNMLIRYWFWSFGLGNGSVWAIPIVGHETGVGSILKYHRPEDANKIGYAGESELGVFVNKDGLRGVYNGEEFQIAKYG